MEDSRLVVLNAMDAAARGATILTRTKVETARRDGDAWTATLRGPPAKGFCGGLGKGLGAPSDETWTVRANAVVNAAGPWVSDMLRDGLGARSTAGVRLIKGSHIVTAKLYEGTHAYILQNPDKRIIFAIPYEGAFTLIGTTDVPYAGEPGPVRISDTETHYLCDSINRVFKRPIAPDAVVWSYSGVRPLFDDASENASAVTRDYVLDLDLAPGDGRRLPLLSVFGGKITTYRRLAEHALEKLQPYLPRLAPSWTADVPLPGGDMPDADFDRYFGVFQGRYPFLPNDLARRLARDYGTRAERILGEARHLADLGVDFGGGLTQREVEYLLANEWAGTADDILWRRSKLGLHLPNDGILRLQAYLGERVEAVE